MLSAEQTRFFLFDASLVNFNETKAQVERISCSVLAVFTCGTKQVSLEILHSNIFARRFSRYGRSKFGLTRFGSTGSRLMFLSRICLRHCLLHVDDLFVYSRTFGNHVTHVKEILKRWKIRVENASENVFFWKNFVEFSDIRFLAMESHKIRKRLKETLKYSVTITENR